MSEVRPPVGGLFFERQVMSDTPEPEFDGIPVDLIFEVTEDSSPVGYHEDKTPCYAFKGRCPKGDIARTADGSPVLDLSNQENMKSFREYIDGLPPSPMPKRLQDGSPKTAMNWFDENLVGKTFSFELPGIGVKHFHVKEGHLFRLVCETPSDPSSLRKGMVKGATSAEMARQMIRKGLANEKFDSLNKNLNDKNLDAAFEDAHALKGIAGNLHLTSLYKAIEAIVEPLRARDTQADYQALYTKIDEQLKVFKNIAAQ